MQCTASLLCVCVYIWTEIFFNVLVWMQILFLMEDEFAKEPVYVWTRPKSGSDRPHASSMHYLANGQVADAGVLELRPVSQWAKAILLPSVVTSFFSFIWSVSSLWFWCVSSQWLMQLPGGLCLKACSHPQF